jgi:hypothetical protein
MADLDLRSLNPRRFVEDALFGEDEPKAAAAEGSAPAVATLTANEPPPYDTDAT